MKKRTLIAAVGVIVAAIAAACVYGYTTGQQAEPPAPPVQPQPVAPTPPVDEPPVTPAPNAPDDPAPGDPVVVYVPDEQGDALTPVGAATQDDSDQGLLNALIETGALPAGVAVQSSSTVDGVLMLDMNEAYGQAVRSSGTTGETMMIYALVNTFAQARGVDRVQITVDGAPLETGHDIYDYPLEPTV